MAVGMTSNRDDGSRRPRRPRKLVVPDVTGLLISDAQIVLTQAGFEPGTARFTESYEPVNTVVYQTPKRGQLVDSDTFIEIGVSKNSWIRFLPQVYQLESREDNGLLFNLLWIFQQMHEQVSSKVDRMDEILRPLEAPEEFLPWLSSWIALQIEDEWEEEKKRRWLRFAPALYNIRGTRTALEKLLEIYTGVKPLIIENEWPDEALRVDITGEVGQTSTIFPPMNLNHCFTVELPLAASDIPEQRLVRIHRVIQAEKPAHTNYYLRFHVDDGDDDWSGFMTIGEDVISGWIE